MFLLCQNRSLETEIDAYLLAVLLKINCKHRRWNIEFL